MTGSLRLAHVVIDVPAADRDRAVQFWTGAIGRAPVVPERYPDHSEFQEVTPGVSVTIQATHDETRRVHLDFDSNDRRADVARLVALGAREVAQMEHWSAMTDPAGVAFCVVHDG